MGKVVIGVVIGLIAGGILTFLLFVGVPRAVQTPGVLIQPPGAERPAGSAQIVLKQAFFNEVLTTIFRDMNDPAFPLTLTENQTRVEPSDYQRAAYQAETVCDGKLTILEEGSGVRTSVRFENNRISAPMAFSGSYSTIVGCIQYTGWAQANLELRFDSATQSVVGRINVETVNLDGVNPVISGIVTPLIQTTLNNRVNPIQIVQGKQLAVDTPIAATGARLRADVTDVRAEFKDDALNLYVIYSFSGAPLQ